MTGLEVAFVYPEFESEPGAVLVDQWVLKRLFSMSGRQDEFSLSARTVHKRFSTHTEFTLLV